MRTYDRDKIIVRDMIFEKLNKMSRFELADYRDFLEDEYDSIIDELKKFAGDLAVYGTEVATMKWRYERAFWLKREVFFGGVIDIINSRLKQLPYSDKNIFKDSKRFLLSVKSKSEKVLETIGAFINRYGYHEEAKIEKRIA